MENIFTGVSWSIGGIVGAKFLHALPSLRGVVERFLPKPNIVYVSDEECWSAYTKLEAYILQKFAGQIRACHLRARHGTVDCSLDEAQFLTFVTDTYEGQEVRLKIMSDNGSSAWKGIVEDWLQMYERPAENERLIAVASWGLDTKKLREYVQRVSAMRKDAAETSMYVIKETVNQREVHLQWEELYVRTNKRLSNTIVSRTVETELLKDIKMFMRSEKDYNAKGIPYTRGYMLYGVPGSGKSSLIKAIAAEYELPVFIIDFDVVKTNATLTKMTKEMMEYTGTTRFILAMEDLDRSSLFSGDRYGASNITVQCLLNAIDGLVESHGRILFITANDPEKIRRRITDGAFMRPGRIDKEVEIGPCDFDQLQRLLQHYYGKDHECINRLTPECMVQDVSPAHVQQLFQKHGDHGRGDPQKLIELLFTEGNDDSAQGGQPAAKRARLREDWRRSDARGAMLRRQLNAKRRELRNIQNSLDNRALHHLQMQRDKKMLLAQIEKKSKEMQGWRNRNAAIKRKFHQG